MLSRLDTSCVRTPDVRTARLHAAFSKMFLACLKSLDLCYGGPFFSRFLHTYLYFTKRSCTYELRTILGQPLFRPGNCVRIYHCWKLRI